MPPRFLISPDKFKGSLTATEVSRTIAAVLKKHFPKSRITTLPLADGGDGSLEAMTSVLRRRKSFHQYSVLVQSPNHKRKVKAPYLVAGKEAFVELAQSSGIALLKPADRNPHVTTTFGTGEVIRAALDKGCTTIHLYIGGSATTDGGAGLLAALGVKFLDKHQNPITPSGGGLKSLAVIDDSGIDRRVEKIILYADVDNPLIGKTGSANVFARGKGAKLADVPKLDAALKNFADVIRKTFGRDVATFRSAGASGGIPAGLVGLYGWDKIEIKNGGEEILRHLKFSRHARRTDWIITGEGKIDEQTKHGKVVWQVIQAAAGKPVVAVCGASSGKGLERSLGLNKIFTLVSAGTSVEEALRHPKKILRERAAELARYIQHTL
jgi:glycerate kinase